MSDWSSDVCSSDLICRGGAVQGLSPQPATSVRHSLLPGQPGHREVGGCAGTQQHRDYPHLPPDLRGGAPAAVGPAGTGFIITEFVF